VRRTRALARSSVAHLFGKRSGESAGFCSLRPQRRKDAQAIKGCTLNLERFDYQAERKFFISVKRSAGTRSNYSGALRIFEDWLKRKALAITEITPQLAADFVRDLKAERRKDFSGQEHPRTTMRVRAIVTACSSFYTHLQRHFAEIRNPFLDTPAVWRGTFSARAATDHQARDRHQ